MWDVVGGSSPRAGFTRGWHSAGRSLRDHPRSRGVYADLRLQPASISGSSPLARGLLSYLHSSPTHTRIIPARAGFTEEGLTGTTRCRDHPRSRGVYTMTTIAEQVEEGSSPLARGLLRCSAWHFCARRIIPARAGFTPRLRRCWPRCSDHPRSRGVYKHRVLGEAVRRGSSPLARGLPRPVSRTAQVSGIIPARAGFTIGRGSTGVSKSDHPRSRGVYLHGIPRLPSFLGSSPLARGLPVDMILRSPDIRIIPARAGFTRTPGHSPGTCGDHPRSRGVYESSIRAYLDHPGSSPLARGLRVGGVRGGPDRGIIPARAGFTATRRHWPHSPADHPRSRGVYFLHPGASFPVPGSSPLARGLHAVLVRDVQGGRIIPARAGFTHPPSPAPFLAPDHPRSRGVYLHRTVVLPHCPGSSPLARGLRGQRLPQRRD